MKLITYNKLVRDKIPEIIEASGKKCEIQVLNDEAYLEMLDKKLSEELKEYQESHEAEELADILEVIYTLAQAHGVSKESLKKQERQKRTSAGRLKRRYCSNRLRKIKLWKI